VLDGPDHAGKYREVEYVADGHGLVFLKTDQMLRYRLAVDTVRTDEELKAFFGATTVARLNPTWSEGLVRFLRNPIVMAVLVVVFLLAMFIEMTHPGVILPGAVATVCLLALVIPPVLIDLSAWWAVAAVVLGIVCVGVELLLIPGFGVFGVVGIILLFGGLLGIFVGGPSGLFPTTAKGRDDLAIAAASILISAVTAGILMYLVGKHLTGLPVVNRLVLKAKHGDADVSEGDGLLTAMGTAIEGRPAVGAIGRTLTPLRPSGRVQIGESIYDVVADMGFIDINQPVRVVAVDEFRTVVERVSA
jgi:membrane-bound serine protease (ClpP class)